MINRLIVALAKFLNRVLPYHMSFMIREKKFARQKLSAIYDSYAAKDHSWAIVMQGPVTVMNSFTFETLKLYRHIYPGIQIILSTWKGEDAGELDKIRTLGVDIVENTKPVYPGIVNINFQIASTSAGILRAKENGAVYVLKTRTDIRLAKNIDFLYFLKYRSGQFPGYLDKKLTARLVTLNINMFESRLYTISDLTMFGHIKDMLLYWNVPFDNEREVVNYSFEEAYIGGLGEFHFVSNFLKSVDFSNVNSEQGYEKLLTAYFAVTDMEEVDMFWYKYRYYMEGRSRYVNLDEFSKRYFTWSYGKWITLFNNNTDQ